MCRACWMNFSTNTFALPKAVWLSRWALSRATASSSSPRTTRIPRPPPPWAALIITGQPSSLAIFSASAWLVTGCELPARIGTPARLARSRAAVLSPSVSRSSTRGPTNVIPASRQAAANSGFSERNP